MYLIQLLLPLADNQGTEFPEATLRGIHKELSDHYGGLTAYTRSPAKGLWRNAGGEQTDDIVIVEVMTETLDEDWWRTFRIRLERLLRQEKVVIRAQDIKSL